jgi:hypothetical protein
MNPTTFTFQQVVEILSAAKIPCVLKQFRYEDGSTQFSVELGFNWPEHLMDEVYDAFAKAGHRVPRNLDVCADSCRPDMIAKKTIAGGQKRYIGIHSWG